MKRLRQRDAITAESEAREASRTPMNLSIEELGLNKRTVNVLLNNDVTVVEDFLNKFAEIGDEGFLELNGIGRQALAEIKKTLRNAGYEIPEPAAE
ncbi:MAG: DNA-directed RNA polymerase subunit alpha C-terminal domain-containing protein [Chloroflexota bacterium]